MRIMVGICMLLAVLLCISPAYAQNSNSGDIRGTVTDATGAVIPGVTVTVVDNDKNITKTYETNGAGLYDTGSIVTDHYTITFTKAGFDTFVRGPITLQVETLTIDGTLRIGATTETVRVTADIALLQTESSTQSTTIAEKEMDDLPNFASWENFIILAPGTAGAPGAGNGVNPGQTASVNGNAVFYNILGDGVTMSLPSNGNGYDYNFDSLSEVQIVTNGFSAQYENGGVIYNQISKGGGSQYHGDVFDYFQNNALNAAPFGFGQPAAVPVLRANYFGGSVGGPVPGPLKKKLFFFFNYNYSQDYGGSSNGFLTVPTAAMLTGDFTGQPTIYDPTTQQIVDGVLVRQSFASEYGNGNKIPSNMISTVAQQMESYFPKPNVTNPTVVDGITTNNYFYNIPSNSPGWSYFWRADYDITPKNRLTVTDFYNTGTFNELSPACPINCTNAHGSGLTGQISDVWTFNSRDINEFRIGSSIQNNWFTPQSIGGGYPAKLGMLFAKADLFPEVNIGGACCWGLGPGTNAIQHQIMFEPSDVVTLIRGKHIFHFGGEFLDQQINATLWGNVDAGSVTFNGVYTNSTQGDGATGLPYADFLLGEAQSWSSTNTPEFYPRMKTVQMFVQDDFKVRPNLTLNLGVRWEGWNGMSEKNGNERSFDPTLVNPGVDPFGNANTLGAMWYGGTPGSYRSRVIAGTWGNFMPRMGFSWQRNSKTVIRGGIGLYAYNYQEGPHAYSEIGFKEGQSGNLTDATNGVLPVVRLNEDGSINDQGPGGSSINSVYLNAPTGADSLNGQGVNFAYYHEPLSKIWQYNLEVQRELTPNMVANIAYVGSHGFDQLFGVDLNQIPADKLSVDDIDGCQGGVGPCYRPYPNFQSIGGSKLIGISNYNALQATIQKRLSNGLLFNFNYTWSHYLDEADPCAWNCAVTTVQNMYDPRANYGPSAFDIRQMFKGRMVYKLPVGKGQRFLSNNSVLSQVVGGWQTSATIQWQTGNPFTPLSANNNNFSQSGYQYADIIGNPHSGPHGTISEWFNVAAYAQPADATYGDATRNSLYGPHLSVVNFSLSKSFSFWERGKFEMRIDTSNLFNHPSFGLPDNYIGPGHTAQITSVTIGGRAVELIGKISF